MPVKHRIYLLPGFFGFANLGELVYFGHLYTWLKDELARRGVEAEIFHVLSHPTASIRVRARDLLAELAKTAGDDDGPIHLVGHSTGGLDARLFVTPGVDLGDEGNLPPPEVYARRVRSVVCVSTPNRGTGIASFFSGLMGAKLLGLLSLFTVYVLRFGRVPLRYALKVAGAIVRMDGLLGWRETLVDQLFSELLADFSTERRTAISTFFSQVSQDQALVTQLTPEGIDLFNAGVSARPGVRYGSVVTQARPPTLRTRVATGLDPYAQVTHNLYAFLHGRAAMPARLLPEDQRDALVNAYGMLPAESAADGIVPTLSQPFGEVIAAVWADHLDVIGHFDGPEDRPPHVDWLISATGFRRPEFVEVWSKVTDFLLRDG
jgi:triacylglycerol lipase